MYQIARFVLNCKPLKAHHPLILFRIKEHYQDDSRVNSESAEEKLKLYFIDFGLGSISSQLEEKAVDLYVLERALLSTHSQQAQQMFEGILNGYLIGHEKDSGKVIERFEQVRLRGRKRTMVG